MDSELGDLMSAGLYGSAACNLEAHMIAEQGGNIGAVSGPIVAAQWGVYMSNYAAIGSAMAAVLILLTVGAEGKYLLRRFYLEFVR